MKKLIALTFAMLFLGAGIASATDFSLTGSYYARGSYYDNMSGQGTDVETFGAYDHELSVDAKWQIDDTTKVFARFEMADETWGTGNINEINAAPNVDDNIYLEQVWGAHTFGNGGTLTVGKMSAGAWGTAFHDAGDEAYRVKWVQPTAIGTIIGILHKDDNGESGSTVIGEDEDDDAYILAMVTKIGDINVKPLVAYVMFESNTPAADNVLTRGMLSFDGVFGNVGFEGEFDVFDMNRSAGFQDYTTWGAYLNVWMNADALKFGILGAYGSYDDDSGAGFDFGDDFEAGGALIMGDDATFFGGNDLTAGTLLALYADYAVSDQLSIGGYLGYATCNVDNNGPWDGADIYEISADVSYKITPNLTYKVAAGFAQLGWGDTTPDPDSAMELYHKLSFSF
ncbi:MAG: hypothetical protein K8S13_03950 [Desulfobacula sp.]|uniref:hypothetical protein n=1 Tax=Desulfobacula sp. TaxID=2593537 RepID=UPI0025C3F663|nr:hypothetical protein [Desulfobacula sp.]MCD4718998.1 hypothetical protein [Desulfobacula sp.]